MTVVTLVTDYGTDDDFAGVLHGVIKRIAPDVEVVHITHGVPRHSIRRGALTLRNTLPYMPAGVHVGVVDPQVGTERRAVAVRAGDGRILVGPDNGLLAPALEALGGAVEGVDVSRSPHRLEPVSATFHGRDLFAPVAAQLAAGAMLAEAGEPLEPDSLVRLELPEPRAEGVDLVAHVLAKDRYGNLSLDATHEHLAGSGLRLGAAIEIESQAGQRWPATFADTFADVPVGRAIVYEDAYRSLAIAVNRGHAAGELAIDEDQEVRLRPS